MKNILFIVCLLASLLFCVLICDAQQPHRIPDGAQHLINEVKYIHPPSTNLYVQGWMHAATCEAVANSGIVEMDYIKLIEEDVNGNQTVVSTKDYNGTGSLNLYEGGLYNRFPFWYYNDLGNNHGVMSNSNQNNGILSINAGTQPNYISHWWTERVLGKSNCKYLIEVRMRISGDIGVQIGCDYWTTSSTTSQADNKIGWVSKWYNETNNQFIIDTIPVFNNILFNNSHYGFTYQGTFFISKELIEFVNNPDVYIMCDYNSWQPTKMALQGNYYVHSFATSVSQPKYYCFKLDYSCTDAYLPYIIKKHLANTGDTVSNGMGGINFYTYPKSHIGNTSINSIAQPPSIRLFPNPVDDILNIELSDELVDDRSILQIYDISGALIHKASLNTTLSIVDMSFIKPGVYICAFNTSDMSYYKLIAKK